MFGLAKIQHSIGKNKLFLFIYQYFTTKGDISKQAAQNPQGRLLHRPEPPNLDSIQQRITNEHSPTGIAIASMTQEGLPESGRPSIISIHTADRQNGLSGIVIKTQQGG